VLALLAWRLADLGALLLLLFLAAVPRPLVVVLSLLFVAPVTLCLARHFIDVRVMKAKGSQEQARHPSPHHATA
jgi:hypothetical protein